jgi:hypothetical protein
MSASESPAVVPRSAFATAIKSQTAMPIALRLLDGRVLRSVGEASEYFSGLGQDQRARPHWRVAIRMFAHTMNEPAYLKAATISLQTAFLMDGLLESELQS